ncbi:MAG: hypothetical protein WCQ49_01050 [Candidatus Saccharibacteria bacterium]
MTEQCPIPLENKNNLESIRNWCGIRGTDDLVVEIGSEKNKENLNNILIDPAHHSREETITAMLLNYSGEAYGDGQWNKTTGGWTTPEVITQYGEMREIHPEFAALSLDTGFMTHLPEFVEMLEKGEITSTDPIIARNELKEKLGYKIMWRGTMLTDEELAMAKSDGIMSPLSIYAKNSDKPKEQFESIALSTYANFTIEKHFHGEHHLTPLVSVSEYEDVATAVGRHFGNKPQDKKFYLFKLKMPIIDLITYKEHAVKTPSKLQESIERNPEYSISISLNDKESEYKWDEKVESYIFWKIDPDEILEIKQPNIAKSTWNGKTTTTNNYAQ